VVCSERLLRSGTTLTIEESEIVTLANRCRLASVRDRLKPILDSFELPPIPGPNNRR